MQASPRVTTSLTADLSMIFVAGTLTTFLAVGFALCTWLTVSLIGWVAVLVLLYFGPTNWKRFQTWANRDED